MAKVRASWLKQKKQYGQNFLINKEVLQKIIQAIPKNINNIVEIGPGLGDLTQELLKISRVKAYEIDDRLVLLLQKKFQNELENGKLNLIQQDASKVLNLDDKKYFLVANLPYYIASYFILKALEDENCLGLIVMVQKEMALKFCAEAGNSEFSALGALSAMICERKLLFDVSPLRFNPQPKVVSSVMSLIKRAEFKNFCELSSFKNFLKICFQAPRKQLVSNLKTHKTEVLEFLRVLGLKENARPHELCVNSYLKIYEKLKDKL